MHNSWNYSIFNLRFIDNGGFKHHIVFCNVVLVAYFYNNTSTVLVHFPKLCAYMHCSTSVTVCTIKFCSLYYCIKAIQSVCLNASFNSDLLWKFDAMQIILQLSLYSQDSTNLFEVLSQVLLNAVDRDALSGWGATVCIM